MSFYLALPCTASAKEFPENTRGKYKTLLAREIYVPGDWEVGLCEIILPKPKFIILADTHITYKKDTDATEKNFVIKADVGGDFKDLVNLETPKFFQHPIFQFVLRRKQLYLAVFAHHTIKFVSGPLAECLGLNNETYSGTSNLEIFPSNPSAFSSDIVYVYSDVCEHSIIGDMEAPCLRVVPLIGDYKIFTQRYENIQYMPVSGNRFSTIEICIADDLGREVKFQEGITIVTLHFRPRK
jgi:hypothetical protein